MPKQPLKIYLLQDFKKWVSILYYGSCLLIILWIQVLHSCKGTQIKHKHTITGLKVPLLSLHWTQIVIHSPRGHVHLLNPEHWYFCHCSTMNVLIYVCFCFFVFNFCLSFFYNLWNESSVLKMKREWIEIQRQLCSSLNHCLHTLLE